MNFKLLYPFLCFLWCSQMEAQIPSSVESFLNSPEMKGASFSVLVTDLQNGETVCSYDPDRELIPASVMKLVTTATALEVLGEEFRFETSIEYDGEIKNGVLTGNLYIIGSGDPTLGSSHIVPEGTKNVFHAQQQFIQDWIKAIKEAGIQEIRGSVIADDLVFDTEGVSPKWLYEDLGSYYGAGSYGISVFDNIYRLIIKTGEAGSQTRITECIPDIPGLHFCNYLTVVSVTKDSSYILGAPYSNERFLYGTVPASKDKYTLRGDIPDPALFLAQYLTRSLIFENISIEGKATTRRLLVLQNQWKPSKRVKLCSTFSPPLTEIVDIINYKSHNLYVDALCKILGNLYSPGKNEVLSSFGKGSLFIDKYWEKEGVDVTSLYLFDGSGLAPTNKVTTKIICDILYYMHHHSTHRKAYFSSLPAAGEEGSVRNFLKGSSLQGKTRLKSGSMSRVKAYAGYITKDKKEYAVAILVNNYQGEGSNMTKQIEKLLNTLF
ncbi:MAG: D-alanyl-D-alanine carboxypeptidase/D-alanyl-D-alanine-endopeptidase [Parabacteroides sp.]|nr:D-alanyl-D-alanine carboxypeptidase/D-alanyl-D-alanine-endopeptidase [Parabacteroides sp.]